MSVGIIDTSVLIHLFRNNVAAKQWVSTHDSLAITSVSWLEFMQGAPGKSGEARCLALMQQFALEVLTPDDQLWAMEQVVRFRLSHGTKWADCLVASVPYRLGLPLYTDNVKDFLPLLPPIRSSAPTDRRGQR